MKKTLVIIFSIILCIALTGAAVALGGEDGINKIRYKLRVISGFAAL